MTGLTGKVPTHPAQYSPEILEVLHDLIGSVERIHDPFAGLGLRLGALCDEIGVPFTGTDIEDWEGRDPRVKVGNSIYEYSYPWQKFTVVTSPVYFGNRISSDYVNGPTENTKPNGRRAYGISLGRALDDDNAARFCRPNQSEDYYALHNEAIQHWGSRVIVNVDMPLVQGWQRMLWAAGYAGEAHEVATKRYRIAGHGDERPTHEYVLDYRMNF